MTAAGPAVKQRKATSRVRRALRWAALAALALALLAALAWLGRNRLAPPLVRMLRAPLAERLGFELQLGASSGDWWTGIELRDVVLVARDEHGALRRVEIERVETRHDWRALLRGELEALEELRAQGVRVEVDLTRPTGSARSDSSAAVVLPPRWPQLELLDVALELRATPERSASVHSAALRLAPDGAFEAAALELALVGAWPTALRNVTLAARGELRPAELSLASLETHGDLELTNGAGRVDLAALARGAVRAQLAVDVAGGRVDAALEQSAGDGELRFALQELDCERVLATLGVQLPLQLQGRATLDGVLQFGADGNWLWTRARLVEACVEGRSIDALELEGAWTPHEVWIDHASALASENHLRASGVRVPLGAGDWRALVRAARGEFELEAHDLAQLLGLQAATPPKHVAELRGRLDEAGLEFAAGSLRTSRANFVLERGSLRWGASAERWIEDATIDLAMRARVEEFEHLGALFASQGWRGRAAGAVRVVGARSDLRGELDLLGEDVAFGVYELGDVSVGATLRGGRLEIARLRALGGLGELELRGSVLVDERRFEELEARVVVADGVQLAATLGFPQLREYVTSGAATLSARLSGAFADPDGRVELVASDVGTPDGRVFERAALTLAREREHWRVEQLELRSGLDALRARGEVNHRLGQSAALARIETLELEHAELGLALLEPASVEWSGERVETSLLSFAGSAGAARIQAHYAPDDLRVALKADDLDPLTLLGPLAPPQAECSALRGELELARDGSGWSGSADLDADGLRWNAAWPPLDLRLRGRADEQRVELEQFALDGGPAGRVELEASARRTGAGAWTANNVTGRARGSVAALDLARLPWSDLGLDFALRGALDASFDAALEDGAPAGRLSVAARELQIASQAPALQTAGDALAAFSLELEARLERELVVERLELNAPGRVALSVHGRLGEVAPWLAAGGANELPGDAPLALRANWSAQDLRWLAELTPALRRVEGALDGELVVGGSWREPRADGEWSWQRGALRLGVDAPPFERIEASGVVRGSRLEIGSLTGELGGGPFELRGALDVGGEGELDLHLSGRELLVVRERDLRLRADAELSLTGTFATPTLSGRVGTRDGRWRQRIEWLPSAPAPVVARRGGELPFTIRGGALERLRYDVAIESAGEFTIETNLGKINLRPALRLGGRADAPTLEGPIFFDPTRISLPGSTLELRAGTLVFDTFAPTAPTLDVTATTRVLGYDVTARVSGRIDALERDLSSSPPLRSEDLSVLLLTGRVPRDLVGNETGVDAAQTVILFLGQDLLSSWVGDDGPSLMERLEWRAGSDATRTGGATAQVSVRLTGSASGVGGAMYLRGERDVYDRINYGVRWVVRLK